MPMQKIVLASNNSGKLEELQVLLKDCGYDVHPQKEFGITDADETGLTFVENAIIKARHACQHSGLPALADDSGIEVDALNGAPGIYSARYSGAGATDEKNNLKLLDELSDVPENERTARYQCVLVFMRRATDPTPVICQGTWEGRILNEPVGSSGFGYDPLFYVPTHLCSSAQLPKEVKNTISHRAIALKHLLAELSRHSRG